MVRNWTWAFAGAVLLAGCSSVEGEPLPVDPKDPAFSKIVEKLDDDEKKLLAGYLFRREMAKAFGGQRLPDEADTVGEALDAQRKWMANKTESEQKAEALKVEVEQKRKVVAEKIAKTVTVAFISARYVPSSFAEGRYENFEEFSFAVRNGGKKPIKALKGQAIFIDTFGDVYASVPMQFEEVIEPGETKEIELGMEINQFMDDHKKIMNIDRSKKFKFEPEQIVYSDGSTLKAPASVM